MRGGAGFAAVGMPVASEAHSSFASRFQEQLRNLEREINSYRLLRVMRKCAGRPCSGVRKLNQTQAPCIVKCAFGSGRVH